MREQLPPDHQVDEHTLIRFARSRKLDVAAAMVQYRDYVVGMVVCVLGLESFLTNMNFFGQKWRVEKNVDHVLDEIPAFYPLLQKVSPFSYHGFDKFGRPCFFRMCPPKLLTALTPSTHSVFALLHRDGGQSPCECVQQVYSGADRASSSGVPGAHDAAHEGRSCTCRAASGITRAGVGYGRTQHWTSQARPLHESHLID